ncbi:MAG TPA: hypothetical protein VLJ62_13095 [Burkholderiaceae bacterium]|nr:hypothetical protein [Burkholderiaceae bacterium]
MSDWSIQEADAPCHEAGCSLPAAGFVRLRYFHGKTMRLADYVDEQRYHTGKMRMHHQRLHGAGILCGLKVSVLERLVLRVGRGAAVDDCGREVIVGWDQCVDVGAWFKRQKHLPRDGGCDPCKPDKDQRVKVCVLLRYAECTGGPEPAPPSGCATPSGCDGGQGGRARACPDTCGDSTDYGRTAEEFELRLAFADEARERAGHALFPAAEQIGAALAQAASGVDLLQALAEQMRQGCPRSGEGWLLLACFDLVIDAHDADKVLAIADIDLRCASQVLLSTEVLQYLVCGLVADADLSLGGPSIRRIWMRKRGDGRYQIVMDLSACIAAESLDVDSSFQLRRLAHRGWAEPASNAVTMAYKPARTDPEDVDGPAIYINIDSDPDPDPDPDHDGGRFLKPGGRYLLSSAAHAPPVVDEALRVLRPRQLAWRFGIERDATGDLAMIALAARSAHHG